MECNCPFCPLVAINLQVTDMKCIIEKDSIRILCDRDFNFGTEISRIISLFKNNAKLKIGHAGNITKFNFTCWVYRVTENEFDFSFSSKP